MLTFLFLTLGLFTLAHARWRVHPSPARQRALVAIGIGALISAALLTLLHPNAEKIVGAALMPAGIIWGLGLCSIAWLWATERRGPAGVVGALWLLATLAGNATLGSILVQQLERGNAAVDPFSATYDAVLVLGGGTATRGDYHYTALSGDRVVLGARLWHTGRTPTLITTGSTAANHPRPHNSAEVTAQLWRELGVDAESIIVESGPTNTREEMDALAALIEQHGWTRVGVVSSARHLPRAMRNAQRRGLTVSPLPADYRGSGRSDGIAALIPSGLGPLLVETAAWEWLGRVSGR